MESELYQALTIYLADDDADDKSSIFNIAIERAINKYRSYVNFPKSMSEDDIHKDLRDHKFCLFDLALYFYVTQGTEFERIHIENNTHQSWSGEGEIFTRHGVIPFASV